MATSPTKTKKKATKGHTYTPSEVSELLEEIRPTGIMKYTHNKQGQDVRMLEVLAIFTEIEDACWELDRATKRLEKVLRRFK